jgi:hypothetical protein
MPSRDSVFMNPVFLCSDISGSYFYYSSIRTSVCNDTLCQMVTLNVFWDLAGNYSRFDTLPGRPLTKNDHIPFEKNDYQKLHATLSDENSILGEKKKEELLDETRSRYSEKLDAVTGATSHEIQSAVVDGALYSTYTLWHLINGEIKNMMREYTLSKYNSGMENQLLKSKNPKTVLFGLKNLDENDFLYRFETILDLMKSGNPLVNFSLAKKIPAKVLAIEENRKSIRSIWNILDRNTQSVLSNYITR